MLILGIVSFSPLLIKQQWRGGGVGMLLMVGVLQTVWCGVIRAQTQTHGNGERDQLDTGTQKLQVNKRF
jgi:hypothetical protein